MKFFKRRIVRLQETAVRITNFPDCGFFVIDSVRATRTDWKNSAIAWTAIKHDARAVVNNIPGNDDYIILDSTGRVTW